MGTITSSIGLISGINTSQIISQLMSLESQPVTQLQSRITQTNAQQTAFTSLSTALQTLQTTAKSWQKPATFKAATATSSDESVLTATAANGAAVGTYSLQVARMVSTQQMVSGGFSDFNQSPVGPGTISIELGGGSLANETALSDLNGGKGVPAGQFRITDRSGNTAVIDTSSDVSVDDVLKQINTSLSISVRASVKNNQIVLTDSTGKTVSNLAVQDLGNGTSASALGLAGSATGTVLTGTSVNYLAGTTALSQLNDGRGIRLGSGGNDLDFTLSNGSTVSVSLATAKTVDDVLSAINTAGNGKLTATIPTNGTGIQLTDTSGGGGSLSVADANGSHASEDLGLNVTGGGTTLTGSSVLAGIDTTLISSLRGGSGLDLGKVNFTDRSGATRQLNFAGASSVQDIIDSINGSGLALQASLKTAGNGIQITSTGSGTGNIVIGDAAGGQTATELGIAGTFDSTKTAVQGADLQKQWVSQNTQLSDLNGGKGIGKGSIQLTNSAGATVTVNLAGASITTVGSVLTQINNAGLHGVTASINPNGNGILLTDTAAGAGKLTVTDVNGTAAQDLNIAGTATGTTLDGAYEKTITLTANDTLATVQQQINNLGFGVSAQVINDGSTTSPYRLSLTSKNSGKAGSVVFDDSSTKLASYNLVDGEDAAVFLGSSNSTKPLLITSSSNQITGVVQGVTINLTGVSKSPVQLNVSSDSSGVEKQITDFTSNFNDLVTAMGQLTSYDSTTNKAGLLLGDPTIQQIQENMYNMLNTVVTAGGNYNTLASIGLTLTDGAKLQFDSSVFEKAYSADPTAVQSLFNSTKDVTDPITSKVTTQQLGVGFAIDTSINNLVDPVSGTLSLEATSLGTQVQNFQDRITELNKNLDNKKNLLTEQFSNMETVLSSLQSQQSALASLASLNLSSSSSSSKSSSSG